MAGKAKKKPAKLASAKKDTFNPMCKDCDGSLVATKVIGSGMWWVCTKDPNHRFRKGKLR